MKLLLYLLGLVSPKAEAREEDIADAIDHVLTFQEMKDLFELTEIDPLECEESERDHSSKMVGFMQEQAELVRLFQELLRKSILTEKYPFGQNKLMEYQIVES